MVIFDLYGKLSFLWLLCLHLSVVDLNVCIITLCKSQFSVYAFHFLVDSNLALCLPPLGGIPTGSCGRLITSQVRHQVGLMATRKGFRVWQECVEEWNWFICDCECILAVQTDALVIRTVVFGNRGMDNKRQH